MGIYFTYGLMFKGKWRISCIFLLFTCSLVSTGQDKRLHSLNHAKDILSSRGETIIRFKKPDHVTLDEIGRKLSVDNYRNDTIIAYTAESGFSWFSELGIPFEVLDPPSLRKKLRTERSIDSLNTYPSYTEYLEKMNSFATVYPEICRLDEFGSTVDGRKLLALQITDNPGIKEKEPVVFYTASMHGDEPLGYILMLRLTDYLLREYYENAEIRDLIDRTEIWINPLANPDGAYFVSDVSIEGSKRFNTNNVDLNRDFPKIPIDETDSLLRQPETLHMMSFMKGIKPTLAANFHSGAEVVNYPWDAWQSNHADNFWYRRLSRAYADTVHAHAPQGYMSFLNNGITKGIDWYKVEGSRQDYVNYYLYGREVTIELSNDKIPTEDQIENYWNYNRESLIHFILKAHTGFTGTVSDSATGAPLRARIRIINHDQDNSFVFSNPDNGNYFRLLWPGTYQVVFASSGYKFKIDKVTVNQGELTNMDIILSSDFELNLSPNPFTNLIKLNIPYSGYFLDLTFIDLAGRKAKIIRYPVTSSGLQEIPVSGLAPGYYIIHVYYNGQTWQLKGVKVN